MGKTNLEHEILIFSMLRSIIITTAEIYSVVPGSSKHFICD